MLFPIGLLLLLAAFALPFLLPPQQPVMSAAYTAGANNRLAAIGVAVVSFLATCLLWYRQRGGTYLRAPGPLEQMHRRWLAVAILILVGFTSLFGSLVVRADVYHVDMGYFLQQLRNGILFHRTLYQDIEFPYGPLLYHGPALLAQSLARWHASLPAAYILSLTGLQIAGGFMLWYTIQALPLARLTRYAAFGLIVFSALTPLLGINYSLFRFVLPLALAVLLSRCRTLPVAIAVAICGSTLALATSPEMGFAFLAALTAYTAYQIAVFGWPWMSLAASGVLSAALFLHLVGPSYLATLSSMAKGGFNLIPEPLPHLLALLIAVGLLGPLAVAASIPRRRAQATPREHEQAGLMIGLYIVSLALLPAALGRCDPLHAFFNGIAAYLLSFVAVDRLFPRYRPAWITIAGLIFLLGQVVSFHLLRAEFTVLLHPQQNARHDANLLRDVEAALRERAPHPQVALPYLAPQHVVEGLAADGLYVPSYYAGTQGDWDAAAEHHAIADMRRADFALIPTGLEPSTEPIDNTRIKKLMRFGWSYTAKHAPYLQGELTLAELKNNWTPVDDIDGYTLYYKVR